MSRTGTILARTDDAACDDFEKATIVRGAQPGNLGIAVRDLDPPTQGAQELTGSQPTSEENPSVPHPGLLPEVISVNAAALVEEYSNGFRNPSFGFPAVSS